MLLVTLDYAQFVAAKSTGIEKFSSPQSNQLIVSLERRKSSKWETTGNWNYYLTVEDIDLKESIVGTTESALLTAAIKCGILSEPAKDAVLEVDSDMFINTIFNRTEKTEDSWSVVSLEVNEPIVNAAPIVTPTATRGRRG